MNGHPLALAYKVRLGNTNLPEIEDKIPKRWRYLFLKRHYLILISNFVVNGWYKHLELTRLLSNYQIQYTET